MSAIWLDISGWIVITHDWPNAKKFSQRLAVAVPIIVPTIALIRRI